MLFSTFFILTQGHVFGCCCFVLFLKLIFRERGRGSERETSMWKRNIDQLPPGCARPSRDPPWTIGMCPDRESQPVGVGDGAPTNWATRPGLQVLFSHRRRENQFEICIFPCDFLKFFPSLMIFSSSTHSFF